ncbi:hypothetical protein HK098_005715 [Nowakowskiella sp. JEL0407]|nr:hypothetical protein HK098_005715 [Nowakowskiella sp. JEL0407]
MTELSDLALLASNSFNDYERIKTTLIPNIRPFKFLRLMSEELEEIASLECTPTIADPPSKPNFVSFPFSTTTSDTDLTVLLLYEYKETQTTFVSHEVLAKWDKSASDVLQQALYNLYQKTTFPLKYTNIIKVGLKTHEPMVNNFCLRYEDGLNVERMLLAYLLMPLKRRLDGDIVLFPRCEQSMIISDTTICGSNNVDTITDVLKCYKRCTETVCTCGALDHVPSKLREIPKMMLRPYRLKITRIDPEADNDADDWTFSIPYQSPLILLVEAISLLNINLKRAHDIHKATQDLGQILLALTKTSETGGKKELKKLSGKNPKIAKLLEGHFKKNALEKFPFHLYLSPRYMTNYRYEWVPFDPPTPIHRDAILRLPLMISPYSRKEILDLIKGKDNVDKVRAFMDRRLEYKQPIIPHMRSDVMYKCDGCVSVIGQTCSPSHKHQVEQKMTEVANKKEKRLSNQVHNDAIWRQTINYELTTAKNWDRNWGFMKEAYQDPKQKQNSKPTKLPRIVKISHTNINGSGLPSKMPNGLTKDPDSIVADWLYTYNVDRVIRFHTPKDKYTFPATTSAEVGWMWEGTAEAISGFAKEEKSNGNASENDSPTKNTKPSPKYYTLERFGKQARGRGDVLKWWGGVRESLP